MTDISIHSPPEKIVEEQLDGRIQAIGEALDADVIALYA